MEERSRAGGRMLGVWQELRQRRFPPEFRIAPAAWPADLLADLQRIEQVRPVSPEAPGTDLPTAGPIAEPAVAQPLDDQALAGVVTSMWRAQRKVESEEPVGPMRQVGRHVQAAWDSLDRIGVKVLDHDGEPFDSGLSLEALAIQPHPGLHRETVIETVKPTIYRNEQLIQMGQVIVGTPEKDTES
ncbi:MAG: hypothetical protein ACRDRV_00630 [Pseudonocardiaceae bacterium]